MSFGRRLEAEAIQSSGQASQLAIAAAQRVHGECVLHRVVFSFHKIDGLRVFDRELIGDPRLPDPRLTRADAGERDFRKVRKRSAPKFPLESS